MPRLVLTVEEDSGLPKKTVVVPEMALEVIKVGEYALIGAGEGETVVKVEVGENDCVLQGQVKICSVRVDTLTFHMLGLSPGDNVYLMPAEVADAEKVVLAPSRPLSEEEKEAIRADFEGRLVSKGDKVVFYFEAGDVVVSVERISPEADGVIITDKGVIEFSRPKLQKGGLVIDVMFRDLGGYEDVRKALIESVVKPLNEGIPGPKGVLLYGPPGVGKTAHVKAVAAEVNARVVYALASSLKDSSYSDGRDAIEGLFHSAAQSGPTLLIIENIDILAPASHPPGEPSWQEVIAEMMDSLPDDVIVLATALGPEEVHPLVRRAGRFDREIEIPTPDVLTRKEILKKLLEGANVEPEWDFGDINRALEELSRRHASAGEVLDMMEPTMGWEEVRELIKQIDPNLLEVVERKLFDIWLLGVAKRTHGYVAADLKALVEEAKRRAPVITDKVINEALNVIKPSALREVLLEIPNVTWDDIGGYDDVKEALKEVVEWPLIHPELFKKAGITPPKGVLLYGPPGTGKTLLAKAVANESGANFIAIKGPEVLSKWVGEGEKRIREVFRRAKAVAPTIIFFDEIDAIGMKRGREGGVHLDTILNQLLTEMDGLEPRGQVILLGATNRPDILDPALLRPGRFDRLILVPAPDEKARLEILKVHTRRVPLASDVNIEELAKRTKGYSGADLEALVREATMRAIKRAIKGERLEVKRADFDEAMKRVKPSIPEDVDNYYRKLERMLKRKVARLDKEWY